MWTVEHNNNIGDGSGEWWAVSNGSKSFECDVERDAQWLFALLNDNQRIRAVALQHVLHNFEGDCPDDNDSTLRDANCPACKILGPNVQANRLIAADWCLG